MFGISIALLVRETLRPGTITGGQHQLGIKLSFLQNFLHRISYQGFSILYRQTNQDVLNTFSF
ncbi:MAG TPA: hypothetical protein DD422_00425 [Akkermansia sp.]|nr:hypothetical protein [Akkermansia sp.]